MMDFELKLKVNNIDFLSIGTLLLYLFSYLSSRCSQETLTVCTVLGLNGIYCEHTVIFITILVLTYQAAVRVPLKTASTIRDVTVAAWILSCRRSYTIIRAVGSLICNYPYYSWLFLSLSKDCASTVKTTSISIKQ